MAFIFLLDGIEFDPPINDRELTSTIKRNANMDGFLVTQDAQLLWQGAAYTYFYDLFFGDEPCSEVEIEILDECPTSVTSIWNGIIKIRSCEFDADACTVKTPVQDNSFYSYINNNKNIDISPTQTGTKNGVEITPPSLFELDMFDPESGSDPTVYDRKAYRVYDLLEHAITVMTDGKVGFYSEYLWNQNEELFLSTGNALAVKGNAPSFVYTFEKLYSELNKLFNLSFYIENDTYSTPTLRIEDKDFFYKTSTGLTFSDIKDLKISADQTKLYGTVMLGSQTLANSDNPDYSFNENAPFYGFKQEKFYPIGQCNLDVELNLVNEYVISSLVIQDTVYGGSPDWYDNLMFVSCTDLDLVNLTASAYPYQLGGTAPPYIYNLNLNNYNKAQRHFGYLPGNLLDSFNVNSNNFHAEKSVDEIYSTPALASPTDTLLIQTNSGSTATLNYYDYTLTVAPYDFPDESSPGNYDLGGNYNNGSYTYTIPSDGRYTFNTRIFYDIVRFYSETPTNPSDEIRLITVTIERADSLSVFIEGTSTQNQVPSVQGSYDAVGSAAFDCVTGDEITVKVEFYIRLWRTQSVVSPPPFIGIKVLGGSYFESNSDNVIVGAADVNYKIVQFEFTYPMSPSDFETLKADPTGLQYFTKWSESEQAFTTRRAWISELKYDHWHNFANIKLVANNGIIQE